MSDLSRRRFLALSGLLSSAAVAGCQSWVRSFNKARVVVVGGGFAGATSAKYLRLLDPSLRVTLIEPKSSYITCPGSNWLFAELTTFDQLTVNYRQLVDRYDIRIVSQAVEAIDSDRREVRLSGGDRLIYDRLIMAPGIDFRWQAIEGYSQSVAELHPHAWQAGPQTRLLLQQLQAMADGGVVVIAPPEEPYRCPPGPYERASLIAAWLKRHKPRSKVIILDPKRSFSKQALFEQGWRRHFGYGTDRSSIEWHSLGDNPVVAVDAASRVLITAFGDRFRGDVINIIPPQQAGQIAVNVGLTDNSGWCPVDAASAESQLMPGIHVIGDAARYAPIPKSAFAANSEAKAAALAVIALLNERPVANAQWINTCYSLITPDHGISVAGIYRSDGKRGVEAVPNAGGLSDFHASDEYRRREAGFARAAYQSLVRDSFY